MTKFIFALLVFYSSILFAQNTLSADKEEAKLIIKEFGKQLKSELVKGMQNGGAINAIEVCYKKASLIADSISQNSDWIVARTSLKYRNTDNKPDEWEQKILEVFEEKKLSGKTVSELEHIEIIEKDGNQQIRFMKAIETGSVCLKCHGQNVDETLKQKILMLYPNDLATDYSKGEIRGAFTLSKIIR